MRGYNICMDIVSKYLTSKSKTLASMFSKYGGVLGKTLSLENEESDDSKPWCIEV